MIDKKKVRRMIEALIKNDQKGMKAAFKDIVCEKRAYFSTKTDK